MPNILYKAKRLYMSSDLIKALACIYVVTSGTGGPPGRAAAAAVISRYSQLFHFLLKPVLSC